MHYLPEWVVFGERLAQLLQATKSDVDLEGQWIEGQHTSLGSVLVGFCRFQLAPPQPERSLPSLTVWSRSLSFAIRTNIPDVGQNGG